jgi:uncharacterized membrane protein
MWVVKYLPEWFFTFCIIIGSFGIIATYFVKFIPFLYRYLIPVQLLSIVLVIIGIYFSGAAAHEAKWKTEVDKLKNDILIAEEKARTASAKIEYVFLDRIQKVKDVQVVVQEKLQDIKINLDSTCKVTPEAVDLVNSAARNAIVKDKK